MVLLCERCLSPGDPALTRLVDEGHSVVHCDDSEDLIEHALRERPAAVICQFHEGQHEMGVLHLLRRVAPELPLILISDRASLEDQRALLSLRPTYFALTPVEPEELASAVDAAIRSQAARRAAP
jgi:DNA-binding response OmpR family regulator